MCADRIATTARLGALVEQFGGHLVGDPEIVVRGVATLTDAASNEISFLSNPRYRAQLAQTRAAAVLIAASDVEGATAAQGAGPALWVCADPYVHFARVAQHFAAAVERRPAPGIHPSASVDPLAQIDPRAHIGAGVVIGADVRVASESVIGAGCVLGDGVSIGPGSVLYPRVTLYPGCRIGARAVIHSGVVIGADGFGFARDGTIWVKIPQTGSVVIGDDVEIGANSTIDRGALGDTVIGAGVKIDNQVQIGHNVRVGEHTAIAGCVGVAGSATIGKRCRIGGAAMILGHLEVGDDVSISVGTLISHSITKPGLYTGFYPASENGVWEKNAAIVRHLDALRDRVRSLEKQLRKGQGTV